MVVLESKQRGPNAENAKLKMGSKVQFQYGLREVIGIVVEERGAIGVGGRQLYSVRYRLDMDEPRTVELPETSLQQVTE